MHKSAFCPVLFCYNQCLLRDPEVFLGDETLKKIVRNYLLFKVFMIE